jgi:hypothetical protein
VHPRYSALLVPMAHKLADLYGGALGLSPRVDTQVRRGATSQLVQAAARMKRDSQLCRAASSAGRKASGSCYGVGDS